MTLQAYLGQNNHLCCCYSVLRDQNLPETSLVFCSLNFEIVEAIARIDGLVAQLARAHD